MATPPNRVSLANTELSLAQFQDQNVRPQLLPPLNYFLIPFQLIMERLTARRHITLQEVADARAEALVQRSLGIACDDAKALDPYDLYRVILQLVEENQGTLRDGAILNIIRNSDGIYVFISGAESPVPEIEGPVNDDRTLVPYDENIRLKVQHDAEGAVGSIHLSSDQLEMLRSLLIAFTQKRESDKQSQDNAPGGVPLFNPNRALTIALGQSQRRGPSGQAAPNQQFRDHQSPSQDRASSSDPLSPLTVMPPQQSALTFACPISSTPNLPEIQVPVLPPVPAPLAYSPGLQCNALSISTGDQSVHIERGAKHYKKPSLALQGVINVVCSTMNSSKGQFNQKMGEFNAALNDLSPSDTPQQRVAKLTQARKLGGEALALANTGYDNSMNVIKVTNDDARRSYKHAHAINSDGKKNLETVDTTVGKQILPGFETAKNTLTGVLANIDHQIDQNNQIITKHDSNAAARNPIIDPETMETMKRLAKDGHDYEDVEIGKAPSKKELEKQRKKEDGKKDKQAELDKKVKEQAADKKSKTAEQKLVEIQKDYKNYQIAQLLTEMWVYFCSEKLEKTAKESNSRFKACAARVINAMQSIAFDPRILSQWLPYTGYFPYKGQLVDILNKDAALSLSSPMGVLTLSNTVALHLLSAIEASCPNKPGVRRITGLAKKGGKLVQTSGNLWMAVSSAREAHGKEGLLTANSGLLILNALSAGASITDQLGGRRVFQSNEALRAGLVVLKDQRFVHALTLSNFASRAQNLATMDMQDKEQSVWIRTITRIFIGSILSWAAYRSYSDDKAARLESEIERLLDSDVPEDILAAREKARALSDDAFQYVNCVDRLRKLMLGHNFQPVMVVAEELATRIKSDHMAMRIRIEQGRFYARIGKFSEAEAHLGKSKNPSPDIHSELARIALMKRPQDVKGALECQRKALEGWEKVRLFITKEGSEVSNEDVSSVNNQIVETRRNIQEMNEWMVWQALNHTMALVQGEYFQRLMREGINEQAFKAQKLSDILNAIRQQTGKISNETMKTMRKKAEDFINGLKFNSTKVALLLGSETPLKPSKDKVVSVAKGQVENLRTFNYRGVDYVEHPAKDDGFCGLHALKGVPNSKGVYVTNDTREEIADMYKAAYNEGSNSILQEYFRAFFEGLAAHRVSNDPLVMFDEYDDVLYYKLLDQITAFNAGQLDIREYVEQGMPVFLKRFLDAGYHLTATELEMLAHLFNINLELLTDRKIKANVGSEYREAYDVVIRHDGFNHYNRCLPA